MTDPAAAIEALINHQQQADMDGVLVTVSRQALDEVLEYLRTPPASQSDEALVEEMARVIAKHTADDMGLGDIPLTDEMWVNNAPEDVEFLRSIARAILPILHRERAAARREAIEEAANEVQAWFPVETIDEPRYAAGKALRDAIGALGEKS